MKLIMTKGLPASGKSTWAKDQCERFGYKRVNKDDLRSMLDVGKWSKKNEEMVLWVRDEIIFGCLSRGISVIVDDTNLAPKHEENLKKMAEANGAEFVIEDFTGISLEICLERDRNRKNSVGEKVIRTMYNQFLRKVAPPQVFIPGAVNAIICDLDGTLCLFGDANPYDREFMRDTPNLPVLRVLELLKNESFEIIFTSGRSEKFREITRAWLDHWGFKDHQRLYMRKIDDNRKDAIIKKEIYDNEILGKANIIFVLDDRDQVVKMWRDQGLTCFQVAEGNF